MGKDDDKQQGKMAGKGVDKDVGQAVATTGTATKAAGKSAAKGVAKKSKTTAAPKIVSKGEKARAAVLAATRTALAEQGAIDLSVKGVAKLSGKSRPLVAYHWREGVPAIVAEIAVEDYRALLADLQALPPSAAVGARAMICAEAIFEHWLAREGTAASVLGMAWMWSPRLEADVHIARQAVQHHLDQYLGQPGWARLVLLLAQDAFFFVARRHLNSLQARAYLQRMLDETLPSARA